MNKIKIIFGSFVFILMFFASYNFSLAAERDNDMIYQETKEMSQTNERDNDMIYQETKDMSQTNEWDNEMSHEANAISQTNKTRKDDEITHCEYGNDDEGNCLTQKQAEELKTREDDEITHCEYGNDDEGNCLTQKQAEELELFEGNLGTKDKKGSSGSDRVSFTNPLRFNTVEELLTQGLLAAIQRIIVVLALVFIAIGAIMILASAGSPETVEKGKKTIYMAILGLALGVGAPSIMKELGAIIGWGGADASALSLSQIALNVLNFLLGITGVLAITMLVIGGIMYLTSAGDEERIESGKKIFKFSLIGIVVVMASMAIVKQITYFFIAS